MRNQDKLTEMTNTGKMANAVAKVMTNEGWKVGKNFFAKPANRVIINPTNQRKG